MLIEFNRLYNINNNNIFISHMISTIRGIDVLGHTEINEALTLLCDCNANELNKYIQYSEQQIEAYKIGTNRIGYCKPKAYGYKP